MSAGSAPSGGLSLLLRVLPALEALRGYRLSDARADTLAGLTVAAVAVPQAMAYALVAGLPPEVGLFTAIVMTAVGALASSSRQLINGPTNAISIAVLSAVGAATAGEERLLAVTLLAFLVGTVQLAITFLRLGDLTRYISHSVVVGFTAGAGCLLILDQVKNLLGLEVRGGAHDHFVARLYQTWTQGGPVHLPTAAIGVASIVLLVLLRQVKDRLAWKLLPDLLLVVVLMAAASRALGLDQDGVKVVGAIPAALPRFRLPPLEAVAMTDMATSALAIGVLGLLEAVAMSKALATQAGHRVDMNQLCLSEGLANFTGSFFQCMPGSGSLTRSAINQQAGAVSQWAGLVSAVAVAAIMLAFAPYARFIPKAALAGILIVSAWRMVDRNTLLRHVRATRFDAIIVVATALSAVLISVEFCVLIGVLLSFLLAVPRAGQMMLTEFVVTENQVIHERLPSDEPCPRIRIFGFEGEMFFGSATSLERHFDDVAASLVPGTKVVVLRVKRARNPDAVGLHTLDEGIARLQRRGVDVLLCGVRQELSELLERTGVVERLGAEHVFREQAVRQTSTLLAVHHACERQTERCAHCPASPESGPRRLTFAV